MKKRELIYSVILFFTVIQCILLFNNRKLTEINKNETLETSITEVKNAKYIKEIENEFNLIKNIEILNYSKEDNKWRIKAEVSGKKDEIQYALNSLSSYNVENYNLKYSNEKIFLELDLVNK
ncbi:hypothetical protein [Clostridium tertium]|uniref:Uncharacterized protein n=1 Tax=Clostridium tertium TaxID=1559 RepID=A0A6N3GDY2_9CLOT